MQGGLLSNSVLIFYEVTYFALDRIRLKYLRGFTHFLDAEVVVLPMRWYSWNVIITFKPKCSQLFSSLKFWSLDGKFAFLHCHRTNSKYIVHNLHSWFYVNFLYFMGTPVPPYLSTTFHTFPNSTKFCIYLKIFTLDCVKQNLGLHAPLSSSLLDGSC